MTGFWVAATLLCVAAVAFLLFPLWRERRRSGRWSLLGLSAALVTVPLAVGLYLHISSWNPQTAGQASEGARLVAQLAERMQRNPDDAAGWRLLGNSYMALGQYVQARVAFSEAWQRSPVRDDALKVSYGEAQILTDRAALTGEAGRLFEEVLESQPDNPKALWYGGLAAKELGREDAAVDRWSRMLELNLPQQIRDVVQAELATLSSTVDRPSRASSTDGDGPRLRLHVRLGEGRSAEQLGTQAALFIFARAPEGGPPVAVIREAATSVPGEFTLSDANSMIAGRSLGDYDELTVVARLSASGQPAEQAGDWYAQTVVRPSDGAVVELVIDQVVQ